MLRPRRLEQSSLVYALLIVSLVLGLSSRLTCSQDICTQSAVRASDTLTRSFARYKVVTHLLTYYVQMTGPLRLVLLCRRADASVTSSALSLSLSCICTNFTSITDQSKNDCPIRSTNVLVLSIWNTLKVSKMLIYFNAIIDVWYTSISNFCKTTEMFSWS